MTQNQFAHYLLFIAMGHVFVGVLFFGGVLVQIPKLGWVNVVGPNFLEGAVAVWFMMFSWPLVLIVIQFWKREDLVQAPFLVACALGALLGISLMPASGFWLMLILAIAGLVKTRRADYAGTRS